MRPYKVNGRLITYKPENKTEERWLNELASTYIDKGKREAEDRMFGFMYIFMSEVAAIALHEQFGFGAVRQDRFHEALKATLEDVASIFERDEKCDAERVYSKAKMDARLRAAWGNPNLPEWNERYGVEEKKQ